MNWNHDISEAPRDGTHVILAMPNKTTLRSYWCEPKNEPAHWCMLSHKNEPVAFMLWPEHPFITHSPETASERPVVGLPATAQMGPQAVTAGETATHFILDDVGGGA